jgi:hypothetical protein
MIDFPNSPTVGQQFTAVGVTWTWDGVKWTASGLGTAYLPLAGGTLTGPLTLSADPAAALQAATKQYVDGTRGESRIINGDMRIDQRNNGASGMANGYMMDRWYYFGAQASKIAWQRQASGPASAGFPYMLATTSQSAYSSLAADRFYIQQPLEADAISDFAWGTANAQPVTLSFWVFSTLTGTFGGSLQNYASTRAYPFTFSIPTVNTWTKIALTILGDTAGTWVMSGNGGALTVTFDLGSGSTYRAPANAWTTGNFNAPTGSISVVATNGAQFNITGVKLEIGSVATPFNRQSLAKSLADCQRYYEQGPEPELYINSLTAALAYGTVQFQTTKRATPSMTYTNWQYYSAGIPTPCSVTAGGVVAPSMASFRVASAVNWNGWVGSAGTWTASAEL